MKIKHLCLIILPVLAVTLLLAEDELALWNRARSIADANLNLIPGITIQEMQTVDKSDKILQSSKIIITHQLDEDGGISNILIDASANGEKDDEKVSEELIAQMLERDLTPKREGIFYTEPGDRLKIRLTGKGKEIEGFYCYEYETEYSNVGPDGKDVKFTGSYWLDGDSGAPIYNVFTMDKTPFLVRNLKIERWFDYDRETNDWYLREILTTTDISMILKRLTNITRITHSDHWLYEREELIDDL